MSASAPRAPAAPDPAQTAAAQTSSNVETARTNAALNRVNQFTPYGERVFSHLGGDNWREDVRLSPAEQHNLEMTNQAQDLYGQAALGQLRNVQDVMSRPMDVSGLPALQGALQDRYGDPNVSRERVEAAMMERLNPQLARDRASREADLANQGIAVGSEAYSAAQRDLATQSNDARIAAILSAGQEQNRLQQLALADASFTNTARQQALQEAFALRQAPMNEAAALLTGQQVQSPTFTNVPQVQVAPTDYLGAQQLATGVQTNNYNQKNANYQADLAGQYGLANTFLQGSAYVAGQGASSM